MFGHCLDALEHPSFSAPLLLNIQAAIPILWVIKSFPWVVPILVILPRWFGRHLHVQFRALIFIRKFLIDWLNRTAQEAKIHFDPADFTICHRLFDPLAKTSYIFPSMQSKIDEALSLLQAGSDTVANTCTVGTFYVLNDKVVCTRLMDELRAQWPVKTVPVDLSFLQNLPYLVSYLSLHARPFPSIKCPHTKTAVIKESLRLSHGFVTPLPRVVGPSGARIAGFDIPPNVSLYPFSIVFTEMILV